MDIEHGIVTLHDPSGAQLGEPMLVELFPPSIARRLMNRVFNRPHELEQRDPIEWRESAGEIPAGTIVSSIKLTMPDGVHEYPVSL